VYLFFTDKTSSDEKLASHWCLLMLNSRRQSTYQSPVLER